MTTRVLEVRLPDAMAAMVADKVASGEYDSESEVVADALRGLFDTGLSDAELRTAIEPAYRAYLAAPETAIPIDEAFDGIESRVASRRRQKTG